jgi:glucose/mannose-6-phosphate isomerase
MEKTIDYIRKYPEMISDAMDTVRHSELPRSSFDGIVIAGMGGSAIGGDLLSEIIRDHEAPISVRVSRSYSLPKPLGKDTLVIFSTYSGETEETLSQFVEARKLGLRMVCFTSGGRLRKWCETLGIPHVALPIGFKPRAALPYLFFTVLEYVQECKGLFQPPDISRSLDFQDDVDETVRVLTDLREDGSVDGELKKAAELISGHRISVYGPEEFQTAVVRTKNQINENSKLPCGWAVFPELDHNEIVGYEDNDLNRESYVVILRDSKESREISNRIESTKTIIGPNVRGIVEIWSHGNSRLARSMSLIYQADLLSYFLAISSGVSPEKTDTIDRLKAELKEKNNLLEKLEKEII